MLRIRRLYGSGNHDRKGFAAMSLAPLTFDFFLITGMTFGFGKRIAYTWRRAAERRPSCCSRHRSRLGIPKEGAYWGWIYTGTSNTTG